MSNAARVGRIVAVGGGKGGVGKSLVSTNLAVALARAGAKVVMLDADLGAPNLHTMFGIMRPQRTVEDFLSGRSATLDEVALATPIPGLRLIAGAEGALGSAHPTFQSKQKLLGELAKLPVDCLLIDVGAGVDLDTIDFFNAADTRLVVMVPEITSLQNGYAFLKIALFRRLQRAAAGLRVAEKMDAAFGKDAFEIGSTMDRVSTFFTMIEDEVPELVVSYRLLLAEFNALLVGNMLHKPADRNALFAIQRMIRERLDIDVPVAAGLRHNSQVRASVNDGRPFATTAPHGDPDLKEVNLLAQRILQQDLAPIRKLRDDFMRAVKKRPIDPNLDAKFEFGLEGIAGPRSSKAVREPATQPAESPALPSEFRQLQRVSERIKLYIPVELDFDGRSYLGQLTEVNEGGAKISGVRAPGGWKNGTLQVVGDKLIGLVAIAIHSSDAATGNIIVTFADQAAAAKLVAELRRRNPNAT
ncbi:MAG: P-loop NTPase [Deltaproteobacteria bacterium]